MFADEVLNASCALEAKAGAPARPPRMLCASLRQELTCVPCLLQAKLEIHILHRRERELLVETTDLREQAPLYSKVARPEHAAFHVDGRLMITPQLGPRCDGLSFQYTTIRKLLGSCNVRP